jgi:hypothetical protein
MLRTGTGRALAGALVAAAVASLSAAPPPNSKFSVAVLRRDGILIPFAAFNGRTWSVPWPDAPPVLPISLSDIPKGWWGDVGPAAPWTAWLANEEKRPLKLVKPVHVPIFCGARIAVATDYRGAAPEGRTPTAPKDGIATAGDAEILPITQVSLHTPDAAKLVAAITEKFNEEETLATENFANWRPPYGPFSRSGFPIALEAFYRASEETPAGEFRTSYVEAVRRYPASLGEEGCGLVTYARAWVTEVAGKKPIINLGARVTYCDRAEVSFLQPFGRVRVETGGRSGRNDPQVFWIYQLSSWRDEYYSVVSVTPTGMKPVVVVGGGGCPKEKDKAR